MVGLSAAGGLALQTSSLSILRTSPSLLQTSPSVLQASPSPISVLGTVGLLAIFLSLTAHLAARNVLGDVALLKALGVGVGPAIISVATQLLSIPAGVGVTAALLVDGLAIHVLYGEPPRTSAYITTIHAVSTVILGAVLTGVVVLFVSAPG